MQKHQANIKLTKHSDMYQEYLQQTLFVPAAKHLGRSFSGDVLLFALGNFIILVIYMDTFWYIALVIDFPFLLIHIGFFN